MASVAQNITANHGMSATIVTCRNPFDPARDRDIQVISRRRRIDKLAPKTTQPFICLLNGEPLLRANQGWQVCVTNRDIVTFIILPQGGGGGSNPLKIVAMMAISYFAPGIGTALANSLGASGAGFMASTTVFGTTVGSIFGAGVSLLGNALLNALIPTPKPPSAQGFQSMAAPSPTYSLSAQGNAARLMEPIPVVYGRHIIYPDFAAEPYSEYAGNEQYLYQLMAIGMGEYAVESIRIEDTPLANFAEVDYEIVPPNTLITKFPINVINAVEVSGQEMLTNVTIGPFAANTPGTKANVLGIDIVMPNGLFYANDDGGLNAVGTSWRVEARLIDDVGAPLGSWVTVGTHSHSAATNTPQRLSYRYNVAHGRYEVKVTRTDAKKTDPRNGHTVLWAGMRAYLPGSQMYPCTIIAMRLRATNNISSTASRRINLTVTRKLPIWNGLTWSAPTTTSSIAWAIADILRSEYGAKAPNTRIDLAQLLALDAIWTARGDTFDAVIDSRMTVWEAITTVAQVGRAKPYMQGGIVHFTRDQAASVPVALFNMRNTLRGSLKTQYIMSADETADVVTVEYFDSTTWKPNEVTAKLPASAAEAPAKVKLFGCTDRNRAWKEGMYMAAANRYRRQIITFNTEMEGFIPTFGDLIAIAHDRQNWGQSGEIVGWDALNNIATLSEPADFSAGGTHYIALRQRDGSVDGPFVASAGIDDYQIVLGASPAFVPYSGYDEERTFYAFGPGEEHRRLARVMAVRPRTAETVEIMCVNEDAAVHTADTSTAPPVSVYWNLPAKVTKPVVSGLNVVLGGNASAPLLLVGWLPASGAESYLIDVTFDDGITWNRVGNTTASHVSFPARRGNTTIRVAGIGLAQGNFVEWTGDPYAAPPPDVKSFLVTVQPDGTRQFDWVMAGLPPDLAGFKLRYRLGTGWGWDDLSPMHTNLLLGAPYETNQLAAGEYTFGIKAVDDTGNESTNPVFIAGALADPRLSGVIYNVLPHTSAWQGTKTDCEVEPETNTLSASDSAVWTDLTTWDGYSRWVVTPATSIIYTHTTIDLGATVSFTPVISAIADGTQTLEEQHSDDDITYSAWAIAAGFVKARYIRIRITVSGSFPRIQVLDIKLNGKSLEEGFNDVDTSALAGVYKLGVGDIRLPLTKPYTSISQLQISLQNVGAGWSWEVVDKDSAIGPRIKIYNASNALADATIDAYVRGY